MNTEEFYKALFERYSFDEEKIRQAALKQAKQPAIQRFAKNYWKPAAGIAAAVAVTVGVTAYASRDVGSGVAVIVSPASALSASERLHEAELNYYNAASEESDIRDIYITFNSAVSYNDIVLALSAATDTDDIKIDRVYFNNGENAGGADAMASVSENGGSKNIVAAKVSAPAGLYRNIQDLSSVYLAELGSADINDDTFVPIEVDDNDPLIGDISNAASSAVPAETTQFSFVQTTADKIEPQPSESEDEESDEPDMITDTTTPPDTEPEADPDNDNDDELSEDDIEYDENDPAAYETTTAAAQPEVPVTEVTGALETGLMTEIYSLNVPNALETLLIDNYAVVLTKTDVYVCSIGGVIKDCLAQKIEMQSPKITFADTKNVIVTGCGADGKRNSMLYVNAAGGNVGIIDAAPFIGSSEIGTIQYSVSAEKYFIKTVSSTGTYIYEFDVDPSLAVSFRPLVESATAVSLAGSMGDMLYYTTTNENGKYALYEFNCGDGSSKEIGIFDYTCTIKSGATFGSFALIPSDGSNTLIFDTATVNFIPAVIDADSQITTVKRKTFFKNSEGTFVISDGVIEEYSENEIFFTRKPKSEYVVGASDPEKITVVKDTSKWRG